MVPLPGLAFIKNRALGLFELYCPYVQNMCLNSISLKGFLQCPSYIVYVNGTEM